MSSASSVSSPSCALGGSAAQLQVSARSRASVQRGSLQRTWGCKPGLLSRAHWSLWAGAWHLRRHTLASAD